MVLACKIQQWGRTYSVSWDHPTTMDILALSDCTPPPLPEPGGHLDNGNTDANAKFFITWDGKPAIVLRQRGPDRHVINGPEDSACSLCILEDPIPETRAQALSMVWDFVKCMSKDPGRMPWLE